MSASFPGVRSGIDQPAVAVFVAGALLRHLKDELPRKGGGACGSAPWPEPSQLGAYGKSLPETGERSSSSRAAAMNFPMHRPMEFEPDSSLRWSTGVLVQHRKARSLHDPSKMQGPTTGVHR